MRFVLRMLALLAIPVGLWAQGDAAFPHARHARLFPTCSGCHAGITTGDASRSFPPVALCASCHDGTVQQRVRWTVPVRRGAGLLVFSHVTHATKAKDVTCESCHAPSGATAWMNVAHPVPEQCLACHTHSASAHLADDNVCTTCHRTLVAAVALSDAQVAAIPRPPSHARADFLSVHGAAARATAANCATCHARESCLRCHVDGARVPVIQALGADARIARLVAGKAPVYPAPADHRAAQFTLVHGATAKADPARCATCHARPSCETCHTGDGARDILRRIPDAHEATVPGVRLRLSTSQPRPGDSTAYKVSMHAAGFALSHAAEASSGALQCASCHAQRFCSDCHVGERVTRRYHVANFVSTHAPLAYGRETNCSACHSTEAFCRDCHRQAGLAAKSNVRSTVFHNAKPLWLLQHGGAARQDLNSCTTCHQQTYCMQCHSDNGSRINPHGPGFNAATMSSKNPQLCLVCHFKNPLGG
jgi:hypothetical protein